MIGHQLLKSQRYAHDASDMIILSRKGVNRIMVKLSKEEQEMKSATDEAIKQPIHGNISDEHAMQTVPTNQLAVQKEVIGMDVQGMEDVPMTIVRPPYVRLVQPVSKNTENDKGKEAMAGNFLFSDTKKEVSTLDFILLRLKHEMKPVDESGNFVFEEGAVVAGVKPQISALCYDPAIDKMYIISLSVTSFTSVSTLYSQFKSIHADKTWRFNITATSEKRENKKGKFYIAKFQIGHELNKEDVSRLDDLVRRFGVVLDKQIDEESV